MFFTKIIDILEKKSFFFAFVHLVDENTVEIRILIKSISKYAASLEITPFRLEKNKLARAK